MEKLKIRIEEATDGVSKLENISYLILLITAFLIPVFFIPSVVFPFQFSKSAFIALATLSAFILWIIARLKDGKFTLPNNLVFLGAILVLVTAFISTATSPVFSSSFIGVSLEVGSWSNFFVMFVLMFLFAVLFRPKERVFYLYLILFFAFFVITAFHVLRLIFGADFLSFGLFTTITSNLLGKWNDLGIFFALVTLLSMTTLELLPLNRLFKILVYLIFTLSLFALIVINFSTIWYVLLGVGVVFSVYLFAFGRGFVSSQSEAVSATVTTGSEPKERRNVSILAGILVLVSLVFLVDGYIDSRPVATRVANQFGISHLEVRPNWESTIQIAKQVLREDSLFGSGLNRFTSEWLLYKPVSINEGIFWNTDFSSGIGLLPTIFVTGGLVGGLAWLFFLAALVRLGVKAIISPINDKRARYLLVSSLFASLFLWAFFIFYTPSSAIISLTFLFTGVFLASLYNDRIIKAKTFSFTEDPKMNFVSVLVLVLMLIGTVTLGVVFSKKFVAGAFFQKAVITANNDGDLDKSETLAKKALGMSPNDRYYQFLAEVSLLKINNLLGNQSGISAETVRTEFQSLLGNALEYARGAVDFDSTNYVNWVSLGRVYEAVVPLEIEGAYESAVGAYDSAVALNPSSPLLDLNRARLEFANKNTKGAKEYIEASLIKKANYTEALFLKSQIEASEGDLVAAIASVEDAAILAPNDQTVFFQLGLLKYNNRDYRGSATAFERSVGLVPAYANAKYYLGLSYQKLGMDDEALVQFNDILTLNPGNQDVIRIISNISAGRDPFFEARAEERPENRDTLPIEDTGVEEEG